jgi:Oxygen-sensitive ribonucleoside-triphosphate reductase
MLKTIKKRDGRVVPFDPQKITDAIAKAGMATEEFGFGVSKTIMEEVVDKLGVQFEDAPENVMPDVERVQDLVEDEIFRAGFVQAGKAYVRYRGKRADVRNLDRGLDMIDEYLEGTDWRLKENSNMSFSLQGLNNHISGAVSAKYWLDKVYPEAIGNAHKSGDLHTHDLSQISIYCQGWDLYDLLIVGFQGVPNKVSAGPAKHLSAALGQIFNFMFTLQGEAAGAQAFSSFDTLLAPFVRYDGISFKDLKQKMQEFMFNMNTSTRVGFSVPFTNLTFDLCPSPNYAKMPAIIGGKPWLKEDGEPYVYGEFQAEMDMINRAFAEVMLGGDVNGRLFTFPIPTYNVTAGFDWDNPVYEPIWQMAGKYGIPYFANFIGSDLNPEDARSLCPLHPNEMVVFKHARGVNISRIGAMAQEHFDGGLNRLQVLHNGRWHDVVSFIEQRTVGCLTLELGNGTKAIMDKRHQQPIKRVKGEKAELIEAQGIQPGVYLPFCNLALEEDVPSAYPAGFAVGAFIGDGSYNGSSIVFSLGDTLKKQDAMQRLAHFFQAYGFSARSYRLKSNCTNISFEAVGGAARAWMAQFVAGNGAHGKRFQQRVWTRGRSFLKGVLDGWYATDGGNSGRIYTVNKGLCTDFSALCGLLGLGYSIDTIGDRRPGRFGDNPVFTLKFHRAKCYGNRYFTEDGYLWFPVKAVQPIDYNGLVCCLQVSSSDHLFQLANGLVTHNCS